MGSPLMMDGTVGRIDRGGSVVVASGLGELPTARH